MITDSLSCSRLLAKDVTFARYKGAPKVKLSSVAHHDLIRTIHLSGKINVSEVILRTHKNNPYASVEEVMGDLQIILLKSWNEFKQVNHAPEMTNISLEELINELPNKTLS